MADSTAKVALGTWMPSHSTAWRRSTRWGCTGFVSCAGIGSG